MGVIKVRRVLVEVGDEVVAFQCNKCGASHAVGDHNSPLMNNIHLFSAGGGYGTEFPGDLENFDFGLCSSCLKALADSFLIEVPVTGGLVVSGCEAKHTERELELWVVDGGWAYPKGACPWAEWVPEMSPEDHRVLQGEHRVLAEQHAQLCEADHPWPTHQVYRHYKSKGGSDHLYEIVELDVFDASTKEPLVVYGALYGDSTTYIRPLAMWSEEVVGPDTYVGPRFLPMVDLTD